MTVVCRTMLAKALVSSVCIALSAPVFATPEKALALAMQVQNRLEADRSTATLKFELTAANGSVQERIAKRFFLSEPGLKKSALYFQSPRQVRGSAFLNWDHSDAEDSRWLYIPVLRRVKRVPSGERGKAFLGTDLSYDDIKNGAKIALEDYEFLSAKELAPNRWQLTGKTVDQTVAEELGISDATWLLNTELGFVIEAEYKDLQGQVFKTTKFEDITLNNGFWSVGKITVTNTRTQHSTALYIQDQINGAEFDDAMLTQTMLRRPIR